MTIEQTPEQRARVEEFQRKHRIVLLTLLFTDVALYGFLVCRPLATADIGYDFRPRWRDVVIGLREWAFFLPFALLIGLALHFIQFHAHLRSLADFAGAWLVTRVAVWWGVDLARGMSPLP